MEKANRFASIWGVLKTNLQLPLAGLEGELEVRPRPSLVVAMLADLERKRRDHRRVYVREYNRKWAKAHLGRSKEARRRERIKNAESYRVRARKYSKTAKSKAWRVEYLKKYLPVYYAKNKDRIRERGNAWQRANPEKRREKSLRWQKKYPEKWRSFCRAGRVKRKARMRGADVGCKLVSPLIRSWRLQKSFECQWCHGEFEISKLHVDHIFPIARGGKHEASNVCKSCPPCNLKKGASIMGAAL